MNENTIKDTAESATKLAKVIAAEAAALQTLKIAEDLYHADRDDEEMKSAVCAASAAWVVLRARRNALEDLLGLAD